MKALPALIAGTLAIVLFIAASASVQSAAQPPGTWTNVTPANANVSSSLGCGNFGTISVVVDPARPANLYTHFDCQGIWRSTDSGQTWTGPIDSGSGARGAGGIAIAPGASGASPILYSAGIRGSGMGFWRSLDGGLTWTNYPVGPAPSGRQDVYPPSVDPYDGNHLLLPAHELNALYQSFNGGQTWTSVPLNAGMNTNGGTAFTFFVNTGSSATTRNTWLYIAQGTGGSVGTWRTTNGGATWSKVSSNEHPHGNAQIYQPDNNGTVYMAGIYAAGGWGVLRSTNYGASWSNVVSGPAEAIVWGTPNNVYAAYGWACGLGCNVDPTLRVAPQPGISGWTSPARPSGMSQGPAQAAVTYDGSNFVAVTANWMAGLWRYVEPAGVAVTPAAVTSTPVPPTSTSTSAPTSTPTNTAVPVPTDTPAPTATPTPAPTCAVLVLIDGVQQAVSRPPSFCTDQ